MGSIPEPLLPPSATPEQMRSHLNQMRKRGIRQIYMFGILLVAAMIGAISMASLLGVI